jgi:hypothetical protein
MQDAPETVEEPRGLKLLKALVIVLMITMIGGLLTIVTLLVIRFPAPAPAPPALPDAIALPEGARAAAFTQGRGWYAVVTEANEILVFDRETGALRQRIAIETP